MPQTDQQRYIDLLS